jgi:Family of unknown function (DUF6247)
MTAEPVHDVGALDPGDDPAAIFNMLPPEERERFRAEYDAALDAAHDLARYRQVADVLRLWRLQAVAYSRPGYREAIQDALDGREDRFVHYVPPTWEDRL